MKGITKLLGISLLALFLGGCAMAMSPVTGFVYMDVKAPVAATSNTAAAKTGTAKAESYLGWIGVGDASIEAAMKSGGITKVQHVDSHAWSILGIYAKYTITVYGE